MILGRGMSRAGGDEPTTTSTTLDDEALARVLQRSLEAKVATGEQQLQSDEQQRNELQLHIDEQQLQSEDEQQLQSDEQTAQALQVYNRVTDVLIFNGGQKETPHRRRPARNASGCTPCTGSTRSFRFVLYHTCYHDCTHVSPREHVSFNAVTFKYTCILFITLTIK